MWPGVIKLGGFEASEKKGVFTVSRTTLNKTWCGCVLSWTDYESFSTVLHTLPLTLIDEVIS